jgi:hypothetical protein
MRIAAPPCRETLQVSLLLLVLIAIFFGDALFTGRKLLPADIAFADPVFAEQAPAGFDKPHNVLLYDQAYQFYPWRVYVSRVLRQGSLPFWNPYTYCGAPLLAEDQPAVFYPLNILSYPFAPPDAALFTAMLRLFVAGLSTYWFVRTIGLHQGAALFSTITFAFSGFMVVWLGHPHTNVAAWLPAMFLTVEWLCRRTGPRNVAFVALVVAAQLTGGHAETALYTLTAGGLYCLFRVWSEWRRPCIESQSASTRPTRSALVRLSAFVAAVLLGFALASVHLLPFGEWLQQSAELRFRTETESLQLSRLGPKYWLAGILPMWLPNVFNNPTWPREYHSFFPGWNFVEQTLYVGIIGWSLAVAAVLAYFHGLAGGMAGLRLTGRWFTRDEQKYSTRQDGRIGFFAATGLVALGAALRVPPFDLLNYLPLFNIAAYGRLRLIYTFCAAVLAGFGAQWVVDDLSRKIQRASVTILSSLALIGAAVFVIAPQALYAMATQVKGLEAKQALVEAIDHAFRFSNVMMYWPILVAAAAACILFLYLKRSSRRSEMSTASARKGLFAALFLLTVIDLFALGMGYHTTIDEEFIFPETPALQLLKRDQGLYRVAATNVDLMPNTGIIHGLQDVRGLDFPTHRYQEFCRVMGGQDWLGYGILLSSQLQPRLLGLLNTKYVLSSSVLDRDTMDHLRFLAEDGQIKVYENLECLPRAFVVHQVQVHTDAESALRALQNPELDLAATIVLEKAPPSPERWQDSALSSVSPQLSQADEDKAEVIRYEGNRVTILAQAMTDGFLFLSDTYYPDWTAYVDGVATEIYRADYAFRAVYLPAGSHVIEFVYESQVFRVAAVTSAVVLLFLVILVANPHLPRKRDRETLPRGGNGKTPPAVISIEAKGPSSEPGEL